MSSVDDFEIIDDPDKVVARTYEEFIRETSEKSKTFEVNGIHYYLRNETDSTPVKKLMKEHGECNICTSRSGKLFSMIGSDGSLPPISDVITMDVKEDVYSRFVKRYKKSTRSPSL